MDVDRNVVVERSHDAVHMHVDRPTLAQDKSHQGILDLMGWGNTSMRTCPCRGWALPALFWPRRCFLNRMCLPWTGLVRRPWVLHQYQGCLWEPIQPQQQLTWDQSSDVDANVPWATYLITIRLLHLRRIFRHHGRCSRCYPKQLRSLVGSWASRKQDRRPTQIRFGPERRHVVSTPAGTPRRTYPVQLCIQ